jgi:serine/threonine-protein kinase
VHRDVKPDNILLESLTGRVLVADFGIAAAAGDAGSDGISGTPEFMSPEQALGGPVDARSDLYGLGATAFFAFSGRLPFEGASATEVLARQVTEPSPPLASLGLPVPRKLAALVDRCLAKSPDHRPATAQALAEQLAVALEQRRELPAALRAFVKRYGRLDGGGTLIAALTLPMSSISAAALFGRTAGFMTFLLGITAGPLAYFIAVARRLSLLGFGHQDLGPAFAAELEQAREELAGEHRAPSSNIERGLAFIAKASGAAFGLSALALFAAWRSPLISVVVPVLSLSVGTAMLTAIGLLAVQQRRSDVDTELWSKLWMGPIGKFIFSVARKLLGNRARPSAMTHRATELSLGMAAEQLFESLPKESRQALGDVPTVLRRLQGDAQLLRKRYDELQEALADLGDAAASVEYADLRGARDTIHVKLGDAVGALETIRLNLLRLHAGSVTVAGLTTHLGIAAEVSAEVERLIAAHEEVERVVRFPRQIASTPA